MWFVYYYPSKIANIFFTIQIPLLFLVFNYLNHGSMVCGLFATTVELTCIFELCKDTSKCIN